jgi:hypothetical protein
LRSLRPKTGLHLVIEHLGFTGFGLWDQGLIEDIEDILADFLQLCFDLLTVFADGPNMFVRSLGLLLLFDGRNYAPGGTSGPNNVLVGHREKIALIDSKLSTELLER